MNDNNAIVNLVKERLEVGKREYKQQVDVHDGRNWTQESLEEALDLAVYLSAEIIKRRETKKYKYLITARVSDSDNDTFLVSNKDRKRTKLKDLKTKIFWALSEDELGEDIRDVHMVSACEITSDFECKIMEGSNCTLYAEDYL